MKMRITKVKIGPTGFTPWAEQILAGRLTLEYKVSLETALPDIGRTEATGYLPAGVWTPDTGVTLYKLDGPFPAGEFTGIVKPVDRKAWEEGTWRYGAFPLFDDTGAFVGVDTILGEDGSEVAVPTCACEAYLNGGLGWSAEIPDGMVVLARDKANNVARHEWTGDNGIKHSVAKAGSIRLDAGWLVAPAVGVGATLMLRAAHRRVQRVTLGKAPAFVAKK
jgi:hypothetical protein